MRTMRSSLLLLALAPALALAQAVPAPDRATAPPSAANVVRLHPRAWHFDVPTRAALRFEPEAGEPAALVATPGTNELARTTDQARARALASESVRTAADGSHHAVLGAAFRQWTVVTIEPDGRLAQDCVSSAQQAQAIVEAAAKQPVKK